MSLYIVLNESQKSYVILSMLSWIEATLGGFTTQKNTIVKHKM